VAGGQCTVVSTRFGIPICRHDLRSSRTAESGSIAGALSHTLSFSPSIGPERGHEKRLINRTNTGTFLPWDTRERKRDGQQPVAAAAAAAAAEGGREPVPACPPHPAFAHPRTERRTGRSGRTGEKNGPGSTIAGSSTDLFRRLRRKPECVS